MEAAKKEHELIVSVSPHLRSDITVRKIMWTVTACLLPGFIAGVYYFGIPALITTGAAIIAALLSEVLVNRMTGKENTLGDGSAVLTGLLLGMNLPPHGWEYIYIPIIGSFVAIAITKMLFGGLGFNIFNPALVGRAFVLITWPKAMTTWAVPNRLPYEVDAATTATPLGILKEEGMDVILQTFGSKAELYKGLLFGNVAGSLGETSALLILIGGLVLIAKRYITWHIPVSFIGTVALFAWVFGSVDLHGDHAQWQFFAGDPVLHILSGGLMIGAFFMATDYVTVPSIRSGQIVFGIGCGLLTGIIRLWGGFPEGVMFAILLMNCFTPLIDRRMRAKTFGMVKPRKEAA
jgi:electron transport complex protein RnfD